MPFFPAEKAARAAGVSAERERLLDPDGQRARRDLLGQGRQLLGGRLPEHVRRQHAALGEVLDVGAPTVVATRPPSRTVALTMAHAALSRLTASITASTPSGYRSRMVCGDIDRGCSRWSPSRRAMRTYASSSPAFAVAMTVRAALGRELHRERSDAAGRADDEHASPAPGATASTASRAVAPASGIAAAVSNEIPAGFGASTSLSVSVTSSRVACRRAAARPT